MAKTITATKDGRTRTFNKVTWDLLPEGKDGWEPAKSAKAPAEVKDAKPAKDEK